MTILEAVVGSRATHEWAVEARVREVLVGLLGGFDDALLDRRLGDLSGGERRTGRAGAPARGRPRPAAPRRADQPPRRRDRGVARRVPEGPFEPRDRGRHPRSLVPRRGLRPHLGGRRRERRGVRRRLLRLRAVEGRAHPAGRSSRGTPQQPDPQGAGLAAPGGACPHVEAEVPRRRGQRAHHQRAAAPRLRRAAVLRERASRQVGGRAARHVARDGRQGALRPPDVEHRAGRPHRRARTQRRRQDLADAHGPRRGCRPLTGGSSPARPSSPPTCRSISRSSIPRGGCSSPSSTSPSASTSARAGS